MLQMRQICAELDESLKKDPSPTIRVKEVVAKGEKQLGTLTPELAALYNLMDDCIRSRHKTEAQKCNAEAMDDDDAVEELNTLMAQLRERRDTLHQVFFEELRIYLNDWKTPGLGVRSGNVIVSTSVGIPGDIKALLRDLMGGSSGEES